MVRPAFGDCIRRFNGSKVKRSSLILIALVLIGASLMGLSGTFPWNAGPNNGLPTGQGLDPGSPAEITSSFRINGNEELEAKAGETNWKGSGTSEDPYIIYNVNIGSSALDFGIYIGNTTSSFIIYQCRIDQVSAFVGPSWSGNIVLYNVTHAEIRETSVRGSFIGASAIDCRNVTIVDLTGDGMGRCGLLIDGSSNVSVHGGSFSDCREGVSIESSNNVMVEALSIDRGETGLRASGCERVIVSNVTAAGGGVGIAVQGSSYCLIEKSTATGQLDAGIEIDGSSYVGVEGASVLGALTGVVCNASSDIAVRDVSVADCEYGVRLDQGSTSSTIAGSSITGCLEAGIYLADSPGNVIYGNTLTECSILLDGADLPSYAGQEIAANNTVNGRPVYYCHDWTRGQGEVPLDAGQVILANVTGLEIGGLDLGDQNAGVLMAYCTDVAVRQSTFAGLDRGIVANNCTGSVFGENTFRNCTMAVHITDSVGVTVEMNDLGDCRDGLAIYGSSGNLVRGNTIADCSNSGIFIFQSPGNEFYGNALLRCSFFLFGDDDLGGDQAIAANNTVNGGPVYHYYGVDMDGASVPLDAGQVIMWSVRNATISGLDLGDQNFGLIMGHCYGVTVIDSSFLNCSCSGMILYSSTNCLIDGNSLTDCLYGVILDRCADCTIRGNAVDGCGTGIHLSRTIGGEVSANTLSGGVGIQLSESDNIIVRGNHLTGNGRGIEMKYSEHNTLSDNRLEGCSMFGIVMNDGGHNLVLNNSLRGCNEAICILSGSTDTLVSGNDLTACRIGILLYGARGSVVVGNVVDGGQAGILAWDSNGDLIDNSAYNCGLGIAIQGGPVTIKGNDISACGTGVALDMASAVVTGNNITGGSKGIEAHGSSGCVITGNNISGCSSSGIKLDGSEGCALNSNIMIGCSIELGGSADEVASHSIPSNNTVNGRPVYYYANVMMGDVTVPADAGEVLLASVADCAIRDLGFDNSTVAVQVCFSENVTVEGCTFDNITSAVMLHAPGNTTVSDCRFTSCGNGVGSNDDMSGIAVENNTFVRCQIGTLYAGGEKGRIVNNTLDGCVIGITADGSNMTIDGNIITGNTEIGVDVRGQRNTVAHNYVDGAGVGIRLRECYYNVVEHNNIHHCTVGVNDSLGQFDVVRYNVILYSGAHGILVEGDNWIAINHNIMTLCETGLAIRDSEHAFIVENFIEHCGSGMSLDMVEISYLERNSVNASAGVGIEVHRSRNISVYYSTITNCTSYGLAFTMSEDNEVSLNRFVANNGAGDVYDPAHAQAYDDCYIYQDADGQDASEREHSAYPSTEWAAYGRGNYWSDLIGPDAEHDGYVDSAYHIAGGDRADSWPLAQLIAEPGQLAADAHHDHVVITWSESNYSLPGPIDGYRLMRNSSAGGNFTVELGPDATSYNDTGVSPYAEYSYTLVAYSGEVVGAGAVIDVLTPDPFPPILVIERPSESEAIGSSTVLISWHGSDPYSGIASYWVKVNDDEWLSAGLDESFEVRGLPEGRSAIYVKAVAMAGNVAVAQVNITVDTIPPSVTIISPANGSRISSSVLTWEGSDSGTGASYEIILDGGARTAATSANEVRFDGLGQGRHIAQVRAVDRVGNFAVAEIEFYLDTVAPTLADRSPIGPGASADAKVWVTFSEAMNVSSVSVFVSGAAGAGSWSGNTLTLAPAEPLRAGASYTVTVTGTDLAGNAVSETWTFSVSTTATLTGQVLDADGRPLAGAVVTLENGRSAVTDRYGVFSLETGEGSHDITVTMPGYLSTTSTVVLFPGQSASLGTVALATDTSGDLFWAVVDVMVVVSLLAVLLFICRRR